MKRLLLTLGIFAASFSIYADSAFHPSAENLTYGAVSNHQSSISYTNNPAMGSSSLDTSDWYFGFGLVTSVGFGAEVGPVDNFTEQIDSLVSTLDTFEGDSIDAVEEIKNQFDSFLINAGDNGSAQVNLAIHPLFPLIWSSRGTLSGSMVLDANVAALAQLRVLDRPIEYNPLEQGTNILQTNTAAYIKVGAVAEGSLAYSRPVLELNEGTLHAGLRGKYYQVGLSKTLIGISTMQDGADTVLEDELNDAKDTSLQSGFGVDLGVLWTTRNYRLGAWVKNANSPSFNYDGIGTNCESIEPGASQDSCFIAKSFADEIDLEESYVMDAQISVEGAVYNNSRNFVASFSADSSPVNDPVGNQIQWVTVSAGYATSSWIIPGIRVGYRKNLAGSELSAVSAGFTLFKSVHVDALYGLESIDVDGTSAPRMAQLNVGVNLLF